MPDSKHPTTLEVLLMLPEIQKLVTVLVNATMDASLPLSIKIMALREVITVVHNAECPNCTNETHHGAIKH